MLLFPINNCRIHSVLGLRKVSLILPLFLAVILWVAIPSKVFAGNGNPEDAGMQSARVESEIQHAARLIELGKISEAKLLLNGILEQTRKSHSSNLYIEVLGLLSDAHLIAGFTEEARDYAQQSWDLSLKTNNPVIKARSATYLGNVYVALGELERADQLYQQALDLAQQASDKQLEINLSINRLHVLLHGRDFDAATVLVRNALKTVHQEQAQNQVYDLLTLSHLAERILKESKPFVDMELKKDTFVALSQAKTLAFESQDKQAQSMVTGYLAELYALDQRYEEAEQLLRQALFLSLESNTRYLSGRWYWQLGRLLTETDQKADAVIAYYDAIGMFRDIQPVLLHGWRGDPKAFRNTIGIVYQELAQLLFDKADQTENTQAKQQTLKNIRHVMEEFKAVELKEYFQDACVTERFTKNRNVELDSLIQSGTAVLYPVLLPDHLLLMLSLSDGHIHYASVPISRENLEAQAREFRSQMNPSSNPRQMLRLSMSLYNQLIRPVETKLEEYQINQLVIVPEGELRTIPFAALYDGERYLVNHYSLAISPGLMLTDNSKAETAPHHVFSGGLSEAVQGFSGLPYVKQEIESISETYTGKTYLDQSFTKSKVLNELENTDYEWVTFSTHGFIHHNFNQSYLLTYDKKLSFDELKTSLQSGQFKPGGVDLLVLSACDTAVGDDRAALGLAGLALKAGVKSTMASLWTVNDKYTAELIPTFLNQLKQGDMSKAQALRAAQLQLINEHDVTHPYYWAAFVIAGNWL